VGHPLKAPMPCYGVKYHCSLLEKYCCSRLHALSNFSSVLQKQNRTSVLGGLPPA
jgi:hypothetical protein